MKCAAAGTVLPLPTPINTFTPTLSCLLSCSPIILAASAADLEKAKEKVTTLSQDNGNDVKLKFYGLYKQVCCSYQVA